MGYAGFSSISMASLNLSALGVANVGLFHWLLHVISPINIYIKMACVFVRHGHGMHV